jgi:hypothetical protein
MTHPYRAAPSEERTQSHWVWRPICWAKGHDWKILRNAGGGDLKLIHHLAGCDADCSVCGKTWRDYESVDRQLKEWLAELPKYRVLENGHVASSLDWETDYFKGPIPPSHHGPVKGYQ